MQKRIGDVHLAWENEAHLEVREAKGELEIVYPPISIRAEPHVAVVDANVDRKGTRQFAEAYLQFAYTEEAQEIFAKHHYRPTNEAVLKRHAATFPEIRLFAITEIAKDFPDAHKQLIAAGGVFDAIYKPKMRSRRRRRPPRSAPQRRRPATRRSRSPAVQERASPSRRVTRSP